ncbi:titin-like isoform X2 [Panulirus ornatus]|uniref:titin-like isoform X2 n=1 Tax=Panulirus ornatus TaxID=150431 RepID=UPI003A892AE5
MESSGWIRDSGPWVCGGRWLLVGLVLILAFDPVSAPPGVLEVKSQWRWPGREEMGEPTLGADRVNVTAVLGHTVTLPCRVSNLRDRTVSWIRSRDLTVLAVDRHTVTSDQRFSVLHPEETEDWLLEVRGVRAGDQGVYDCQVNTHPKMSTKIFLKVLHDQGQASILDIPVSDTGVVSPQAAPANDEGSALVVRVLGERWVRVAAGWTLRLVCRASGKALHDLHDHSILHNDPLISWSLDGVPVTALWQQNKVLVRESWSSDLVESELEVRRLHPTDGGAYACVVPYANPDRVTVSVTTPQKPVGGPSKLASSDEGRGPASPSSGGSSSSSSFFSGEEEASEGAVAGAAAGRAAVISGAIILALLLIQMALCVFYIKKV